MMGRAKAFADIQAQHCQDCTSQELRWPSFFKPLIKTT